MAELLGRLRLWERSGVLTEWFSRIPQCMCFVSLFIVSARSLEDNAFQSKASTGTVQGWSPVGSRSVRGCFPLAFSLAHSNLAAVSQVILHVILC